MKSLSTLKLSTTALTISLILISGCSKYSIVKTSSLEESKTTIQVAAAPQDTKVSLVKSADEIQRELRRLDTVSQAGVAPGKRTGLTSSSRDLDKKVSLTWVGDLSSATQSLAKLISWNFRQEGTLPLTKPMVRVDVKNVPAFDVLRNIGLQGGRQVGVTIDEKRKTIIVTYLGNQ